MPANARLEGVPGGGELWHVDGNVYLVYITPNGVPLAYHVPDPDSLAGLVPGGTPAFDRTLTHAEFVKTGALAHFGTIEDIVNTSEHPWRAVLDDYATALAVRPSLRNPEIAALYWMGILEGRAVTREELEFTQYFQNHTTAELQWEEWAASHKKEAVDVLRRNKDRVREWLLAAGYVDPPEGLVEYYGERYTFGQMDEETVRREIVQESDPYAPGASPFAGKYLPPGAELVAYGGKHWIRFEGRDYEVSGEGQMARFGGAENARQGALDGQFFTAGGQYYFRDGQGRWHVADGPGQIRELQRMYGQAVEVPEAHIGEVVGSVASLFGGATGAKMEDYVARGARAGDAGELLGSQQGQTAQLGQEERVRELLLRWLGPRAAAGYSREWIAREAGQFRHGGKGAEDALVDRLRTIRQGLFPNYDANLTYEDIAGLWVGTVQREWGETPDQTQPWFEEMIRRNDAQWATEFLTTEGMKANKGPVVDKFNRDFQAAFGPQVRAATL